MRAAAPILPCLPPLARLRLASHPLSATLQPPSKDVANLVLDGADGIVLGSETFRGKFPVAAAETVQAICRQAEHAYDSYRWGGGGRAGAGRGRYSCVHAPCFPLRTGGLTSVHSASPCHVTS